MRLKTTITLEFEGEPERVLMAALTRGIAELRRGIQDGPKMTGSAGIKEGSVKIIYTTPEVS